MKFDSSKAWNEAAALVAANRDVLLALAGVFIVLPLTALALFAPQPEPAAGADPEALFAMVGEFYREHWLKFVGATLVTMIGSLAMLALFTDRSRPTVGEAIKHGLMSTPTLIAAQLLLGLGLGLAIMVPVTLFSALGVPALVAVAVIAAIVLAIWVWVRLSLLSPAIMVDGLKNPVTALQRSWNLTKGNAGRLLVFFVLVGVAFLISIAIIQMVLGLILSLILPGEASTVANALIGAMLQAVMSVYFVGIFAAAHRQLAGPSGSAEGEVFI
jgi:hypothetical protein